MIQKFILVLACFFLISCSTPSVRLKERSEAFQSLSETQKKEVLKGEISKGMNADAVYIAFGEPSRLIKSVEKGKKIERWIYQDIEVQEIPAWREISEKIGDRTIVFNKYEPISTSQKKDRFEVIFKSGKVNKWRNLPVATHDSVKVKKQIGTKKKAV